MDVQAAIDAAGSRDVARCLVAADQEACMCDGVCHARFLLWPLPSGDAPLKRDQEEEEEEPSPPPSSRL